MSWWSLYDREEVANDFARIAASGFDSVRIFLTWEDFQPCPRVVDRGVVATLVDVADLAGEARLELIPTLFTGHMSGVNWIPKWALGGSDGDARFRVVSGGSIATAGLRNWYSDAAVIGAQCLLAAEAAAALRGHDAIWAWDLGNENSNCVIPPNRESARAWLARVAAAIRGADDRALVTIGLHMEDLEEDRRLGPREAARSCDFLSMHGYPIYASWADGETDDQLLPFLALVTRWLGGGKDVLFGEFGLPTYRREEDSRATSRDPRLVDEEAAAVYTGSALEALRGGGCLGAMLWCYSDYGRARWSSPPLDLARHERSFGLWRADGSPKPSVARVAAFAGAARRDPDDGDGWIDIDADTFLLDPSAQLRRLYGRYRSATNS
jgi:endo-1,4-beta-mannosidase